MRRSSVVLLLSLLLAGCGVRDGRGSVAGGDPHAPRNGDERIAASRFTDFVAALDRDDASAMCAHMSPRLSKDYRCESGRPRIPEEVREVRTGSDLLVAVDPAPDDLQVSVNALGGGSRLVGIFSEGAPADWRMIDVLVGAYG